MDNEWQWQQENAKLRNALAFYANSYNYGNWVALASSKETNVVMVDRGEKARKVLEELANEFSEIV